MTPNVSKDFEHIDMHYEALQTHLKNSKKEEIIIERRNDDYSEIAVKYGFPEGIQVLAKNVEDLNACKEKVVEFHDKMPHLIKECRHVISDIYSCLTYEDKHLGKRMNIFMTISKKNMTPKEAMYLLLITINATEL